MTELPKLPPLAHGERPETGEGCVWLGDLSGFEIGGILRSDGEIIPILYHRCGWDSILEHPEGIRGDFTGYLANTVVTALQHIADEGCARAVKLRKAEAALERGETVNLRELGLLDG